MYRTTTNFRMKCTIRFNISETPCPQSSSRGVLLECAVREQIRRDDDCARFVADMRRHSASLESIELVPRTWSVEEDTRKGSLVDVPQGPACIAFFHDMPS